MNPLSRLARRWRFITIGAVIGLLLLIAAWQLWSRFSWSHAVRALALSIPLLLPLIGILRGRRYTYRWATLCVLPYFIVGMTEVIADPHSRTFAAAMLTLALLWFVALVAFLRVTHDAPPDANGEDATASLAELRN